MAYNREWDQGKDWKRGSDWSYNTNVRGREEEDYGGSGEKRRRYNYNDDSSAQYDNGPHGHWGQEQEYNETSYDDRRGGGAHNNRRRHIPSEATQHVIFLGLDTDFTEGDLQAYLQSLDCSLDSVTIIRDRGTGLSKGFGFAQFTSVEHARAFLEPNFPFINVPPPASHGASATAAFKRAIETGGHHSGRRVKIDFSQSAHNSDRSRPRMPSNDGTRDIGTSPSTLVLLRGLDPITTPAAIALALRSAAGPGKDGAKGLRRVLLIKDRVTGLGCGFAFLEFVDQMSASTLLGSLMSPQLHPSGFRINDKPMATSFAHPFSFQPLPENALRDDASVLSSNNLGGSEGFWMRYWDETSSVAEMSFDVEEPAPVAPAKDKHEKKKKEYRAPEAEVSAFLGLVSEEIVAAEKAASSLPVSDKPVTLSLNKIGPSISKSAVSMNVRAPVAKLGFGIQEEGEGSQADDDVGATQTQTDEKVTASKRIAPLIASKKVANSISKWNTVQEELAGKAPTIAADNRPALVNDDSTPLTQTPADLTSNHEQQVIATATRSAEKRSTPGIGHGDFEYADSKKMACFLCSRQFKSLEQLRRHNQESDLHKKNLQDSALREIASEKAVASRDPSTDIPKYRDRAQERRVLHNQPDAPVPEEVMRSKRKAEAPPLPPPPPSPAVAPAKDESNKGNKLLQKMGWSQGMGLGTDGEGRVDPIQTAIYAQGAGLGASKGKDIEKYVDGYSGYVHMARDAARERFEQPR